MGRRTVVRAEPPDPPVRTTGASVARSRAARLRATRARLAYAVTMSNAGSTGATDQPDAPAEFLTALRSLRAARIPEFVAIHEVRGPAKIAPYTAALDARVGAVGVAEGAGTDAGQATTGKFVLLYDPDGQAVWEGNLRVVVLVRASLDGVVIDDPLLAEVAWDWLDDALADQGAQHLARAGAVTKIRTTSFGDIASRDDAADVEVRASWTPTSLDLAPHLQAWAQLLCAVSGLEPQPAGVSVLRRPAAPLG